jgi:hypothetical protein
MNAPKARKPGCMTSPTQPAHVASTSAAKRDATTSPIRRIGWPSDWGGDHRCHLDHCRYAAHQAAAFLPGRYSGVAAGALFAYAWHAFISPPAFDSASIVVVRVSNVVFAALALAAVSIAARRISDLSDSQNAIAL